MSDRQQLAEHGTNFCIAALGIIAAVIAEPRPLPVAVLTHGSPLASREAWATAPLSAAPARPSEDALSRQSRDITEADIVTASALLSENRGRIRFEPARMSRAVASGDIDAALLRDVFGTALTDLDPGPRRAIEITLRAAFDIFRANPKYREAFTQAMVMDLLATHQIAHSLLESIKDDTAAIRETQTAQGADIADIKALLQSFGGFPNAAAQAETLAVRI